MIQLTIQEEEDKLEMLRKMRQWLVEHGVPDEKSEALPEELRHLSTDIWYMVREGRKLSQVQARQLAAVYRSVRG